MREAFAEKAEAEKILQVKAAEAEAESKYLSGLGVAKQRKAIVDGLKDTVAGFSKEIDGAGPQDVMDLLLVTQVPLFSNLIMMTTETKFETDADFATFQFLFPCSISICSKKLAVRAKLATQCSSLTGHRPYTSCASSSRAPSWPACIQRRKRTVKRCSGSED